MKTLIILLSLASIGVAADTIPAATPTPRPAQWQPQGTSLSSPAYNAQTGVAKAPVLKRIVKKP